MPVVKKAKKLTFQRDNNDANLKVAGSPIRASLRPRAGKANLARSLCVLACGNWTGYDCTSSSKGVSYVAKGKARAAIASADPKNRRQALATDSAKWQPPMDFEYQNHLNSGSFRWVNASSVPSGRKLVNFTWVFKTKRDGTAKARLCVQGCTQVAGIDYDQTFSATMHPTSLRVLSAIAAEHNMGMRRWDFVAAYLQGSLLEDEVLYCRAPAGYERVGSDGRPMVCEILKPIYGMAQSGRRWQRSLFPWMLEQGFSHVEGDPCLFEKRGKVVVDGIERQERLVIGVYVDDLAVLYSHDDSHSLYSQFVSMLQADWKAEDEGELSDLLGIEFSREPGVVKLSQSSYIDKLVDDFFPSGVPSHYQRNQRPFDDELEGHVARALSTMEPPDEILLKSYQQLVGSLLYLATNTRPDVAYTVGMLCRCMGKPSDELLDAARRALAYLHRTRTLGLRFECDKRAPYGMSDSDWAVKHSTTGWVFMLHRAAISWGSKKQKCVALSSCEAEIMAGSDAAKEAVHLGRLSEALDLKDSDPMDLFMDNQSAIAIAYNPEMHQRTKHIDRRHFFIRELVEDMKLRVPYVRSIDNLADFFTKAQPKKLFFPMRDIIMNVPLADRGQEYGASRVLKQQLPDVQNDPGHELAGGCCEESAVPSPLA